VDLSCHLCVTLHCASFLWGCLYMCVLHYYEGKRGISIAGLLAVEFVYLGHSHQHRLYQRHWKKLNCWTCDSWLFGSTVEVVTLLVHFQNFPHLKQRCLTFLALSLSASKISSDISLGLSSLGLLTGPLITPPITRTVKCLMGRITSSLCNTTYVNSARSLRN
jgi:hypothetical protein